MKAPNALQAVLDSAARDDLTPTPPASVEGRSGKPRTIKAAAKTVASEPKKFHRPSRDNRRFIGGHFHPNVAKQLRMLAAEDDTTVQALLEEALNLLLVKKGKGKIAELST